MHALSSFWKFNNSLLDDKAYLKLITDRIPFWLTEISYNQDVRVQWDWIKYNIRKETIQYSKVKAKQRRERMIMIENKLKLAEEKVAEIPTIANQNELENLKIEYEKEYEYITKGAITRSRASWYEKREKNNKYFLNLERNNKRKSMIRKVEFADGNITTYPKKIMDESVYSFYSDLYSETNQSEINQSCPFLDSESIPKLSPEMQQLCEGELSVAECYQLFKITRHLETMVSLSNSTGASGQFLVRC